MVAIGRDMKKKLESKKSSESVKSKAAKNTSQCADTLKPLTFLVDDSIEGEFVRPDAILQMQKQVGNKSVQKFIKRTKASKKRIQLKKEKPKSLTEILAKIVTEEPKAMAIVTKDILADVYLLYASKKPGDRYFKELDTVYWGLFRLVAELKRMPAGSVTTAGQRKKAKDLMKKLSAIKAGISSDADAKIRRELAIAKDGVKGLRTEMLYAYHDIYAAGKEPGKVKMGAVETIQGAAEKITDLLKNINEADAIASGRSITPLIPILGKSLSIVKLITGWKVTESLAAPASKDMKKVENALSLATAGLGLTGLGAFLPLFAHLGPLVDGIAKGWAVVVAGRSKKNSEWWEARAIRGTKLPHPESWPGGGPVFNYMKDMFRSSSTPSKPPSKKVVEFFAENSSMFNKALKEVMGRPLSKVPTKSSLFSKDVDPMELNGWVFYNRDTVWRLIYGRGTKPPEKK
jgi:hypothetical protein